MASHLTSFPARSKAKTKSRSRTATSEGPEGSKTLRRIRHGFPAWIVLSSVCFTPCVYPPHSTHVRIFSFCGCFRLFAHLEHPCDNAAIFFSPAHSLQLPQMSTSVGPTAICSRARGFGRWFHMASAKQGLRCT